MKKAYFTVNEIRYPILSLDVAVIGSGCAGLNAADWLYTLGRHDIAIITEGIKKGTSRNTGSDKQTYYKLTLSGGDGDSVGDMADDLFSGMTVDGDTALAEAAGSVRSFIKLCNLGVPFPLDEYGQYAGYKTDHDPRSRATSAGPLTSKMMTEALERSVLDKKIPVLDNMTAFRFLKSDKGIEGLICINHTELDSPARGITVIRTRNIIMATGGPAACYLNSVYPESQSGMSGMALEVGARAANLHEWQYGLASLKFRWNVSGTYQQVLPRYFSLDSDGTEHDFLVEHYGDVYKAMDMVFLKGYQWPFDTAKLNGSSSVDMLVHKQTELGRRVYMDFRRNPMGLENGFEGLGNETKEYLSNSLALFGTPIQRLKKMNSPAIELYASNGIDLYNEPLEIGVCAQHHNGGIEVDVNWQSSVKGLYVVGEAAGTFGVSRPGGSALNSTQVGSLRAAEHIAYNEMGEAAEITEKFLSCLCAEISKINMCFENLFDVGEREKALQLLKTHGEKMSRFAGHCRSIQDMTAFKSELESKLRTFFENVYAESIYELAEIVKLRDTMITQLAVLSAMLFSADTEGTHGSALVDGKDNTLRAGQRIITYLKNDVFNFSFLSRHRKVRRIPDTGSWFENVWNDYRKKRRGL